MLTCNDYYDSAVIYEDRITFAQVLDELSESNYSKKEIKQILRALVDELVEDFSQRYWE